MIITLIYYSPHSKRKPSKAFQKLNEFIIIIIILSLLHSFKNDFEGVSGIFLIAQKRRNEVLIHLEFSKKTFIQFFLQINEEHRQRKSN